MQASQVRVQKSLADLKSARAPGYAGFAQPIECEISTTRQARGCMVAWYLKAYGSREAQRWRKEFAEAEGLRQDIADRGGATSIPANQIAK